MLTSSSIQPLLVRTRYQVRWRSCVTPLLLISCSETATAACPFPRLMRDMLWTTIWLPANRWLILLYGFQRDCIFAVHSAAAWLYAPLLTSA